MFWNLKMKSLHSFSGKRGCSNWFGSTSIHRHIQSLIEQYGGKDINYTWFEVVFDQLLKQILSTSSSHYVIANDGKVDHKYCAFCVYSVISLFTHLCVYCIGFNFNPWKPIESYALQGQFKCVRFNSAICFVLTKCSPFTIL